MEGKRNFSVFKTPGRDARFDVVPSEGDPARAMTATDALVMIDGLLSAGWKMSPESSMVVVDALHAEFENNKRDIDAERHALDHHFGVALDKVVEQLATGMIHLAASQIMLAAGLSTDDDAPERGKNADLFWAMIDGLETAAMISVDAHGAALALDPDQLEKLVDGLRLNVTAGAACPKGAK